MEWTRSALVRVVALAASASLVLTHWREQDVWFWIGVALVALNAFSLIAARRRADDEVEQSHRLADLLSVPGVAAAFAAGPQAWRQVSHLDDSFDPMPADEIAAFVWLEHHDGWEIGLGDEVKPYLDLDLPEEADAVVRVLKEHPAVEDAWHEDREVYRVEQRRPISAEEFAELAARALVAHHVQVAARP